MRRSFPGGSLNIPTNLRFRAICPSTAVLTWNAVGRDIHIKLLLVMVDLVITKTHNADNLSALRA